MRKRSLLILMVVGVAVVVVAQACDIIRISGTYDIQADANGSRHVSLLGDITTRYRQGFINPCGAIGPECFTAYAWWAPHMNLTILDLDLVTCEVYMSSRGFMLGSNCYSHDEVKLIYIDLNDGTRAVTGGSYTGWVVLH